MQACRQFDILYICRPLDCKQDWTAVSRSGRLWQKQTFRCSTSFPFQPLRDWHLVVSSMVDAHTRNRKRAALPPVTSRMQNLPCTPSDPACFFFHRVYIPHSCLPRTDLSTTSHGPGPHHDVRDLFTERRKVLHTPRWPPRSRCARLLHITLLLACPMKASFRSCDDRLL